MAIDIDSTTRMKFLYTSTTYPPSVGGAQIHHHLLARSISAKHSVQVISHWDTNRTDWLLGTTLKAPTHHRHYTIDGIPVHRLGLSWQEKIKIAPYLPLYYPVMGIALPRISAGLQQHICPYAQEYDLIHNVRLGREGLSDASWQAARHHDIPFVFTPVHHPRWVGWRYRAYINLYRHADAVIALTHAEKQVLIELGVKEEKISITGIGPVLAPEANAQDFRDRYNIQGPLVLFLGQHYRYKGYQELLDAAPLVWQKVPDAQFVFIGPAVKKSEQAFVNQDRRIHRLGKVDLQEKTNALAACTLLCVPSMQESFGGVYPEAWHFGKPVIGCQIPSVSEIISDGVDGYTVQPQPAQIAERICHLLLHETEAQAMGKEGKKKLEAKFTWERLSELTEQAYLKTMGSSP
jgi:glycosyltransferase involved in cell wall biosynthesis